MTKIQNNNYYDLEQRTLISAKNIRSFAKKLSKTIGNFEDIKQLIKSSGSAGANYIEVNESLSKKDFIHRVKICLKEVKESCYWLRLLEIRDDNQEIEREKYIDEATQLMKIFGSIFEKTK